MLTLPPTGPHITFLLGGARSGKSRIGEELVSQAMGTRLYVATAEARDMEMSARIEHHQARRGADWVLIEEPVELARVLTRDLTSDHLVLVDCLTLWLNNLMERDVDLVRATDELVAALAATKGRIVLISNEVGQGIVPDNALARRFRDEAGFLHQKIATASDQVAFIVAGLPLILKENTRRP
ncbi:MAG: bifunctional adenosylcobinamide kinase/adenosylcobinamide-phosphate guanylyltransferase [Parvibaculum sp.]